MRLVLAALMAIIVFSFYLGDISSLLKLSYDSQIRLYQFGIFCAAAVGGYGVVLSAFGLILPARHSDRSVRILPLFLIILGVISLFFYLLSSAFVSPPDTPGKERLRNGETITI